MQLNKPLYFVSLFFFYKLYIDLLYTVDETHTLSCSRRQQRKNKMAKQVSQKMQTLSVGTKSTGAKYDTIRLYLCTWNVGAVGPPKDLTDLLGLNEKQLPDIYAVGFQEMDPGDDDSKGNNWTKRLTLDLGALGYVALKIVRMQAIALNVYVKRSMLLRVTSVESEYSKAGMGGWWESLFDIGNKGGVSVRFDVGGANLIIVNTHLAAHMENMAERIEDFNTVLATQKFRDPDVENILDHDYVFWMGDLNCRLENISKETVEEAIQQKDYDSLLKLDQLKRAQKEGLLLVGFQEGPITFKPTYKFDKDSDIYDTSEKQRVPAWCDRILYRVQSDLEGLQVKPRKYDSPVYSRGDHKPVIGSFDVNLLSYKSHPTYKESDHKPMSGCFDVKIFSSDPFPFVEFDPIPKWKYGKTQEVHYKVRKGIEPDTSPWDWIALFKANFSSFDDYVTYVYGVNNAEDKGSKGVTVEMKGKYLETPPGKYVLCYISKYKNWLRGMSNEFEIVA